MRGKRATPIAPLYRRILERSSPFVSSYGNQQASECHTSSVSRAYHYFVSRVQPRIHKSLSPCNTYRGESRIIPCVGANGARPLLVTLDRRLLPAVSSEVGGKNNIWRPSNVRRVPLFFFFSFAVLRLYGASIHFALMLTRHNKRQTIF